MRRLLRWAFNFAVAVSAVLFVGAVFLWGRGRSVGDFLWHNGTHGSIGVFNARGGAMVTQRISPALNRATPGVGPPEWEFSHERPPRDLMTLMDSLCGPAYSRRVGFAWGTSRDQGIITSRNVVFPLWAVLLATAIAPVFIFGRFLKDHRHRRRQRRRLCPSCGYDLRATPSRCPECGRVPAGNVKG